MPTVVVVINDREKEDGRNGECEFSSAFPTL
jgi:hypothetical protein